MLKGYNSTQQANQLQVHRSNPYFGQNTTQFVTTIGLALVLAVVASGVAHAGTGGTEFDAVNNRIIDMVEGGGGKLAAGLGVVAALATSVIRFNIWSVIGAFGVGAMAGYGIPIVTSSISAII